MHQARTLPAWPLVWTFVAFPLWWFLGLADLIWMPMAIVMAFLLARLPRISVPRQFGLWLLFLVMMFFSAVELSRMLALFGFADRAAIYVSSTVIFVYVYNARAHLSQRRIAKVLVGYWLGIVAFGYADVLSPQSVFKTPGYYVMQKAAPALLSNDLVNMMFVRHLSSFDATSFFEISPRPSAPFVYANNWGNAYSLLLPIVIAYLIETRVRRHAWWLLVATVPLSAVPAFLTLNRGMFLGLGIAMVYVAVRLAFRFHVRAIMGLGVLALLGLVVFSVLPVQQGLDAKQEASTTTRSSLYRQSLDSVAGSPVFGYGAPIASSDPNDHRSGTQGQVWMLLVSHGPLGHGVLHRLLRGERVAKQTCPHVPGPRLPHGHGVSVIELAYYGVVPYGLPLMMVIAATAVRPADRPPEVTTDGPVGAVPQSVEGP